MLIIASTMIFEMISGKEEIENVSRIIHDPKAAEYHLFSRLHRVVCVEDDVTSFGFFLNIDREAFLGTCGLCEDVRNCSSYYRVEEL